MLLTIASLILAIVFCFKAYNTAIKEPNLANSSAAKNIRIAGITVATALAAMFFILIVGLFMVGAVAITSPSTLFFAFGGVIAVICVLLILILLIVALVYVWLAYSDSLNTSINVDILIAGLAITIAIISPFFISGSFGMPNWNNFNINVKGNMMPQVKAKSPKINIVENGLIDSRPTLPDNAVSFNPLSAPSRRTRVTPTLDALNAQRS